MSTFETIIGTIFSIVIIFLLLFAWTCEVTKSARLVICGGGSISFRAIEFAKKGKSEYFSKCVVVSCDINSDKKWNQFFDDIIYVLPEDLAQVNHKNTTFLVIDGGNQFDYLNRLDKSVVQKFYDYGVTIIATSAGSMLLSEHYFTAENGTINSAEAQSRPELVTIGSDYLKIKYLEDTIIDTHYEERDRQGRLNIFMQKCGAKNAIGIDEGTALAIGEYGHRTVFGLGNVHTITKGN